MVCIKLEACTSIGVEVKFRNAFYEVLISPCHVPELNILEVNERGLVVGGAVTLNQLQVKLRELVQTMPGKTKYVRTLMA